MREPVRVVVDAEILDLVPLFLENRREDLGKARSALAAADFGALGRLGHDWKGAGAGYGFDRVSELGAALGEAAKAEDAGAALRVVADLEEFLERVEVVGE